MEEIKEVSIKDKRYPRLLKEIKDPPQFLYLRGELQSEEICFGLVGTRVPSAYGKQAALNISGDLTEAGLTIVSGLAPGIDTFSHLAAVERKKRTIAILGTGLDEKSIYPQENLGLTRRILENQGCLISEYPPGTHGSKLTFPKRNRIISGISLGILVVEAKEKSGALITATFAFSQKRKVFALPGPIYSSNSRGCHLLIKKGAKLAEGADDILKELNLPKTKNSSNILKGEDIEESLILKTLQEESLDIEKIIERTGLTAKKVASALAVLEIKGRVRNLGGNIFALKNL